MPRLRLLLFPFALMYGGVLRLRHWLYDAGCLRSHQFGVPLIAIGNLALGGTGKTPMSIWLASRLSKHRSVAVLSRGYGRKSRGFLRVDPDGDAADYGDEPLEMANALPGIPVAVCEDRSEGVRQLMSLADPPQVIILDDALQHRAIDPGFRILLTTASRPFFRDLLVPAGTLRDLKSRAGVADAGVLTKCTVDCGDLAAQMKVRLKQDAVIACTALEFGDLVQVSGAPSRPSSAVLVSGIAEPGPFFKEAVRHFQTCVELPFADHHSFSEEEVQSLMRQARAIDACIVTTAKDWMRLRKFNSLKASGIPVLYIPVVPAFTRGEAELLQAIEQHIHAYEKNQTI